MKRMFCAVIAGAVVLSTLQAEASDQTSWVRRDVTVTLVKTTSLFRRSYQPNLRAGYYRESGPLRGCALYLQGFADSVANQSALFQTLSNEGFRVIFFDYPGQGGSEGSMNDTRVVDAESPANQISWMASAVWNQVSTIDDKGNCQGKPRILVGWSTGGLAAYLMAKKNVDAGVILLSPGLSIKPLIGELASKPWLAATPNVPVITSRSLTRAAETDLNPHVDAPKPNHPLKAPLFATNLLLSSKKSLNKSLSKEVRGLAFFGGDDSFVSASAGSKILKVFAPHVELVLLPGARHEVANELPDTQEVVFARIKSFLRLVR